MDLKRIRLLSFDCYGTLVDWKKSVQDILTPFFNRFGPEFSPAEIFEAFLKADRVLEKGAYRPYCEILGEIVLLIADELKVSVDPAERYILSERFDEWRPFPDTVDALRELRKHYRLAIISNVDDNLFEITAELLEVDFDYIITAQQLASYKPSERNFIEAGKRFELDTTEILHVAQSIYHDIVPAGELGMNTAWVNRYSEPERTDPAEFPDLEVPDLKSLVRILRLEASAR